LSQFSAEEQVMVDVYRRVDPAVVNITVSQRSDDGALADFATGSGFVIDAEGHIVTNNHVVEGSDAIRVTFYDGTVMEAALVGRDPFSDLAVIKVSAPANYPLTTVPLGDSDAVQVGQTVIAIGNPFGLKGSMSVGIVSALGRTLQGGDAQDQGVFSNPRIIQTDAAINPGNSGGPLLNSQGQVIGVNAAIRTESGSNSGVGFAIPSNTVRRITSSLINSGTFKYAYLGISAQSIPTLADLALEFDVPVTQGVLITQVVSGGPSDAAGLRGATRQEVFRGANVALGGDIITAIDGTPVKNFDELIGYLLANCDVGQTVTLTVIRDNQEIAVQLTLGERPTN
jgi:2-alkenal reductase